LAHRTFINVRINGVPYSADKVIGDLDAPSRWTMAITSQTKELPKISAACILKVTFLLPPNKFPKDFPYGSDLDNLLKLFLDALNETVFSEAKGNDSCIISLIASKARVARDDDAGALLEILPVDVD
jgi:Holliday junction resolvase RusA-like endonuclease